MADSRITFDDLAAGQVRWLVRSLALDMSESSSQMAREEAARVLRRVDEMRLNEADIEEARALFEMAPFIPPFYTTPKRGA